MTDAIPLTQAVHFARTVLTLRGVPDDIALDVAEHLVESDRVGYASHGLSILPHYVAMLDGGHADGAARPECFADQGVMLCYDAHLGLGQHGGKVVIDAGLARAHEHGQCIVTLKQSHHLGRMGHYGERVAAAGGILLAFTNVIGRPPMVAPFNGSEARLTTNPLCFAGPMPNGRPPFVMDMATSTIAMNKARVLAATGQPAPPGALIDAAGHPTNDPAALFTDPPGALLPFGGHKGYALGLAAELLAGVLSGGGTIQPAHKRSAAAKNNMFALIIDPRVSLDTTWQSEEVEAFTAYLKSARAQPGADAVQYPGEYEAANRERQGDSLVLAVSSIAALNALAASLGIAPIDG